MKNLYPFFALAFIALHLIWESYRIKSKARKAKSK